MRRHTQAVQLAKLGKNVGAGTDRTEARRPPDAALQLSGKRLQLLKEAVPRVTRVGVLRVPESLLLHLQASEEAARTLGLELRIAEAAAPGDIPAGFEAAVSSGAE